MSAVCTVGRYKYTFFAEHDAFLQEFFYLYQSFHDTKIGITIDLTAGRKKISRRQFPESIRMHLI